MSGVGIVFSLSSSFVLLKALLAPSAPVVTQAASAATDQTAVLGDPHPELVVLLLTVTGMVLTAAGPQRRRMGMILPRPAALGMIAAFSLTLACDKAVVYLQLLFPAAATEPAGPAAIAWADQSALNRFARSVSAGVFEEYELLAVPVGVAALAYTLIRFYRRRVLNGSPHTPNLQKLGYALAAGLLFVVPRSAIHAYQGDASVVGAAVWTSVHLTIYMVYKSIWPLMLAHFSYDFFVAGGSVGALSGPYLTSIIALLTVGTIAALSVHQGRGSTVPASGGPPNA